MLTTRQILSCFLVYRLLIVASLARMQVANFIHYSMTYQPEQVEPSLLFYKVNLCRLALYF